MQYQEKKLTIEQRLKEKLKPQQYSNLLNKIQSCSQSQEEALWQMLYILEETPKHVCLQGAAGSGKSYLAGILKDILVSLYPNSVYAAASTHQAKRVLSKSLGGFGCVTLHSLLDLKPEEEEDKLHFIPRSKSIAVLELNDDVTTLESNHEERETLFLIIDEVSMVDSQVFTHMKEVIPEHVKIIGIGDPYQLPPVYQEDHKIVEKSRFFTDSAFCQVHLSGVMRQSIGSPIIKQSEEIRLMQRDTLTPEMSSEGVGIIQYHSIKAFADAYLERVHSAKDALDCRILAFTNNKVNEINRYIRQQIHKTNEPLIVGEYLILQEPVRDPDDIKKVMISNGEILEVVTIQEKNKNFCFNFSKQNLSVNYAEIEVRILYDDEQKDRLVKLNIIPDEKQYEEFKKALSFEALQLKIAKRQGLLKGQEASFMWHYWWKDRVFFISTKSIFASTVHKTQGTTLDSSFVYTSDFAAAKNIDLELYYQLLYVAITRAKNQVHFI